MMKRLFMYGVVLATAVVATFAAPSYATNTNPAGNNGFVKINNEITPDSIPQNHPHVPCTFSIEFYNYDKNNTKATVQFDLQAPTVNNTTLAVAKGNLTPFIGEDGVGGSNDLDAREYYTLAFTGPAHEKQGYHVKVTVDAPGSKGSDKKYKVFWVQPCATTPVETEPEEVPSTTTPTEGSKATEETAGTTLPRELPRTGGDAALVLLGSFASVATYAITLRRNN